MNQISYHSMTEPRRHPFRGFCLRTRRFSISRLSVRFFYLCGFLCKWKVSYGQAVKVLKRSINLRRCFMSSSKDHNEDHHILTRRSVSSSSSAAAAADGGGGSLRRISYNYASSFYSDAISDCLEYIKMSHISVDHENSIPR